MFKKLGIVQVSAGLLFVIIVLWVLSEEEATTETVGQPQPVLNVSTIDVKPQTFRVKVSVVGTTQPRWPLEVISAVEGRVVKLTQGAEPGDLVSTDMMLVSLDETQYRANVAASEAQVKQAELELARYQHEQTVVQQISGTKTLSAFGRFEPHIQTAKANLVAARDAKSQAVHRLQETRFYPPFDAVVLERGVVPGQWVNVGDKLFTLIASDSIDVYAELSSQQIATLGNLEKTAKIRVTDPNNVVWDAKLRHRVPSQSSQTRQSQLVFYIEKPFATENTLLPNSMVTVTISGQEIANVVAAPSSVLTPDGFVWTVENEQLVKAAITIHEEFDHRVWFKFEHQPEKVREIVLFPLSTMLEGQKIAPESMVVEAQAK